MTAVGRAVRTERASSTQEAILVAAERLYAEHGVFAVSNRQVSEAAGQGNNAAVGYHFGTKADLVRAIEQKHRGPVEELREQMVADLIASGDSAELRGWVACLVRPLTEHLAALGNPSWYARFAAQAMTDPAYYNVVVKGALSSPSLVQVVDGIQPLPAQSPGRRALRTQHHGPKPVDAYLRRSRTYARRRQVNVPTFLAGCRIRPHRRDRGPVVGSRDSVRVKSLLP